MTELVPEPDEIRLEAMLDGELVADGAPDFPLVCERC
jgi:hypothetical protein